MPEHKPPSNSSLIGLYALVGAPLLLALYAAALFVAWGWAGRAYHFMVGGF